MVLEISKEELNYSLLFEVGILLVVLILEVTGLVVKLIRF